MNFSTHEEGYQWTFYENRDRATHVRLVQLARGEADFR
jgi:hypothetical protein